METSVVIWAAGFCGEGDSQRRSIEKEHCWALTYWLLSLDAVDTGCHWLRGLDLLLDNLTRRHFEDIYLYMYSIYNLFLSVSLRCKHNLHLERTVDWRPDVDLNK
jgi:hypothetical protein